MIERMRLRNVVAVLFAVLATAAIWLGWTGSVWLSLVAVLLFGLAWGGVAASALGTGLLALPVLRGDAGAAVPLATALATGGLLGVWLRRRMRALEHDRSCLHEGLHTVLGAAYRASRYEDPDELMRHLPEFFAGRSDRRLYVFKVSSGKVESLGTDCELCDPALLRQALENGEPYYREGKKSIYLLPLCDGYVVGVEADGPLCEDERDLAKAFTDMACVMRERQLKAAEARYFGQLLAAMASSDRLEVAMEDVLQKVLPVVGATSGAVLMFRSGRFEALARAGNIPPVELALLKKGLPPVWGGIWQTYVNHRPMYVEDYESFELRVPEVYDSGIRAIAHLPVSGGRRARIVMVVQDEKPHPWTRQERAFLEQTARGMGLMAEQFVVRERLNALLRLEREVMSLSLEGAYEILMKHAVRLVPGAEAGSLLVRSDDGRYSYVAALGYDLEGLRSIRYSLEDLRDFWYHAGADNWSDGEPRVISTSVQDIASVSYKTAPMEVIDPAGRVREIRANICFPIVYQGEVLAVMNLDAFSDADAFDDESVEVARLFAQQAALLLHEQHYRELLERSAHSDPLTELHNRRAFDEDYAAAWARAKRYGYPLAVLIMDLSGFKAVNDTFGHVAGDRVLRQVAAVLLQNSRDGDRVYRWGGDEFAILLPHTDLSGAVKAAQRYTAALSGVCVDDVCVSANNGAAAYPEDAEDAEQLLKLADSRMYKAKAAGLVVEPQQ